MQQAVVIEYVNSKKEGSLDFTYIFETYYKRIYNYYYYRVQNQYISEDLTSQLFEKVMTKISSYESDKGHFEVWLFAIARNVLNDYFRSQKKYPWSSLDSVLETITEEANPEQMICQAEETRRLLEMIKTLREKERNIIAYKFGAHLKNKEIAELLGISEKNVSVILCRTLKKLKWQLEGGDTMRTLEELAQKLGDEDFSQFSNKEEIRKRVLKNLTEKEEIHMKQSRSFKKPAVAVASVIVGISLLAQTAIAKELAEKIKEVFSIANGNINIIQEAPRERPEGVPVPEHLKGQIFDRDGNEVKTFTDEITEVFTKSGEKIAYLTNDEQNKLMIVTEAQKAEKEAKTILVLTDVNQRNDYTCFDVKLPESLPEGYQFDHIELYKNEQGKVENSKYIDIYYTNKKTGNRIFMQQRFADEETGFTIGTDGTVECVKVNGAEALMMDE